MVGWENVVDTGKVIADPIVTLGNSIVSILPGIIGAILIAVFGYIISTFIGMLVKKGFKKAGLDAWVESTGKHEALGNMSVSYVLGGMLKWFIFSLFLVQAVSLLQLDAFSSLLATIALWIPKIIISVLIVLAGIIFADIAADKISHAEKITWVAKLNPIIKFFIILFFLETALKQLGITFVLAELTYLIIVGGITLALALAIGISSGFALRKEAESLVGKIKKKF